MDPRLNRIGYAYVHNGDLLDPGIRNMRASSPGRQSRQKTIKTAVELLDKYRPGLLILPKLGPSGTRRSESVGDIVSGLSKEAADRDILVVNVATEDVHDWCRLVTGETGRMTKALIHEQVAQTCPSIRAFQPRVRKKNWHAEPYFTPMFDAVAMYCAWRARFGGGPAGAPPVP